MELGKCHSLDDARTSLHEGIYAKLWRKVKEYVGNLEDLKGNFPGVFDFYVRHSDGWQHEQMAAYYRKQIVKGLRDFDNGQHSDELYQALAWRGLMGDGELDPSTGLPDNPTVVWENQQNKHDILDLYNNFKKNAPTGCR